MDLDQHTIQSDVLKAIQGTNYKAIRVATSSNVNQKLSFPSHPGTRYRTDMTMISLHHIHRNDLTMDRSFAPYMVVVIDMYPDRGHPALFRDSFRRNDLSQVQCAGGPKCKCMINSIRLLRGHYSSSILISPTGLPFRTLDFWSWVVFLETDAVRQNTSFSKVFEYFIDQSQHLVEYRCMERNNFLVV